MASSTFPAMYRLMDYYSQSLPPAAPRRAKSAPETSQPPEEQVTVPSGGDQPAPPSGGTGPRSAKPNGTVSKRPGRAR